VSAIKYEVLEGDAVPGEYRKQGIKWIRNVSEWKWWEYSTLTSWGSNADTPMVSIKNLKDIESTIEWLNVMLKADYSQERLQSIEETIQTLQSLKDEPFVTPVEPTDTTTEPIDKIVELMSKSKLYN